MATASKYARARSTSTGKTGVEISISGTDEILKNIILTKDQSARLQQFVKDEGNKLRALAADMCPKDTGRLRQSHRVLTFGRIGAEGEYAAYVVAGGIVVRGRFINYAAAVHEGSRAHDGVPAMPSRPWMRKAIREFGPGFVKRIAKAVKIYGTPGGRA